MSRKRLERDLPRRAHRDQRSKWIALVALGWLALTCCSCTAIGFGIGTAATAHQPPRRVSGTRVMHLRPGTHVGLILSDAKVRNGTIVGRAVLDDSTYDIRLREWGRHLPQGIASPPPTRDAIRFQVAGSDSRDWYERSQGGTTEIVVAAQDVQALEVRGPRTARRVFTVFGLIMDTLIIFTWGSW